MTTVTFTEFRRQASKMLSDVEKGEVLVIERHRRPIAELCPVGRERSREPSWRRPGLRLTSPGASLSKAILEERESV
jgi:antitoxin (DNA-binding transcriptional repressor) of toxin-antitoxin stability system